MKYAIAALAFLMMAAVGCTQVPPASPGQAVSLTWNTPAAGCASGCTYAVYRCSGTAAACAVTSGTVWAEITTVATRPSSTAYEDKGSAGLTAYYNVEAINSAGNGPPSNVAGPFSPVAPPSGLTIGGSVQTALAPELENLGPLPAAKERAALTPAAVTGLRIVR